MIPQTAFAAGDARPEREDSSGLKAWNLLGEYYRADQHNKALELALDGAFPKLDSANEAEGAEAGEFLITLLRQVMADEKNGRAVWRRSMAWGGGADSPARALRVRIAGMMEKSKAQPAAVPVAQWILENDRLPDGLRAAVAVLAAARNPAGDEALRAILKRGSFWRPAVVMALIETGKRTLQTGPGLILKWASDPCPSIRAAAADCLKQLGLPAAPVFDMEKAFTPELEADLRRFLDLLVDPPARDARFGEYKVTRVLKNGEKDDSTDIGWLRARTDQYVFLTNWYGENCEIPLSGPEKAEVEFSDRQISGAVEKLVQLRREEKGPDTGGRAESLSKRGGFSAQFEPGALSVPEGIFSAWLWSKGEKEWAGKVIFPRLDLLSDRRWAGEIMRDLIGGNVHLEMLAEFSYNRNYGKTVRLAKHLSQPIFDDYQYQARARELVAQLPAREADFKTLTLPPPEDWKQFAATASRDQQLEYLASRFRLLNCFQWSQPGDVDFHDAQYREPGARHPNPSGKDEATVINPLNEMLKLKPAPADFARLAPFLKDGNYLPTFSYWRNFHPGRTMHRVNELIAQVINEAAMHDLVGVDDWQELASEEKDRRVEKMMDWAREMSGKAPWEIIRVNLERAAGEWQWFNAARFAVKHSGPELMGALLAGAERFPERKEDIIKLAFRQGDKGVLKVAGQWSQLPDPEIRIYSALSLIRHGTAEQRAAGLEVLGAAIQESGDYSAFEAVEVMLSLNDNEVTGIACSILRNPKLDWPMATGYGVVHRLFLTKHPGALRILSGLLASREDPHQVAGRWNDTEVKRISARGDDAAKAVAAMRPGYKYEEYAPDEARVLAREELAHWLAGQAALLKEGMPTPELKMLVQPSGSPRWEIDAP